MKFIIKSSRKWKQFQCLYTVHKQIAIVISSLASSYPWSEKNWVYLRNSSSPSDIENFHILNSTVNYLLFMCSILQANYDFELVSRDESIFVSSVHGGMPYSVYLSETNLSIFPGKVKGIISYHSMCVRIQMDFKWNVSTSFSRSPSAVRMIVVRTATMARQRHTIRKTHLLKSVPAV